MKQIAPLALLRRLEGQNKPKHLLICDTEHSHANRENGDIIALAATVLDTENFDEVDRFIEYGRPRNIDTYWNKYAENIHKISKATARTFQPQKDMGIKFLKFVAPYKDSDMPFVYHGNNYVDYDFTEWLYKKLRDEFLPKKDILKSFRSVFPSRGCNFSTSDLFEYYLTTKGFHHEGRKLSDMAAYFHFDFNHHDAFCRATL